MYSPPDDGTPDDVGEEKHERSALERVRVSEENDGAEEGGRGLTLVRLEPIETKTALFTMYESRSVESQRHITAPRAVPRPPTASSLLSSAAPLLHAQQPSTPGGKVTHVPMTPPIEYRLTWRLLITRLVPVVWMAAVVETTLSEEDPFSSLLELVRLKSAMWWMGETREM